MDRVRAHFGGEAAMPDAAWSEAMAHAISQTACRRARRRVLGMLAAASVVAIAGPALATDGDLPPVSAPPPFTVAPAAPAFESFPAHLLPARAEGPDARAGRSSARAAGAMTHYEVDPVFGDMIDWSAIGPLEMQQPMRFNESDVLVKIRAPGGRGRFARLEVIF